MLVKYIVPGTALIFGVIIEAYPVVAQVAKAQRLTDREAWAQYVGLGGKAPLPQLIYILLGVLMSETHGARAFARDVASLNARRPRMGPTSRFHSLKIMADGLPLDLLVTGSKPVWRMWARAQNMYEKQHGSHERTRYNKEREDNGRKRKQPVQRAGKDPLPTFKRQRENAMRKEVGGKPPTGMTIFNDNALDRTEVLRVRHELQAENDLYQKVFEEATKKREKKVNTCKALSLQTPGALKQSHISSILPGDRNQNC